MNLTVREYEQHAKDFNGICLKCKSWKFGGVEGDAENYECEDCGENKVMGMLNLLVSENIEIY